MNHPEGQSSEEASPVDRKEPKEPQQAQEESPERGDQSPFKELEDIFQQDENAQNRKEMLQDDRIRKLEEECDDLKGRNWVLRRRLGELEEDAQVFEAIEEWGEDDYVECELEELHDVIDQYKAELEKYRESSQAALRSKDTEIAELRAEVEELRARNDEAEEERKNLANSTQHLELANEDLLEEIAGMEQELHEAQNQQKTARIPRYSTRGSSDFEYQIQQELEALIQKLMGELEHERGQKRRLKEELRAMQDEMIGLEKELTAKNNKIYALSMQSIRSARSSGASRLQEAPTKRWEGRSGREKPHVYSPSAKNRMRDARGPKKFNSDREQKSPHDRNDRQLKTGGISSSLRTFTLSDVVRGDSGTTAEERCLILGKVVEFYLRKYRSRNFTTYPLDCLVVSGFNSQAPAGMVVRSNGGEEQDDEETFWDNVEIVVRGVVEDLLADERVPGEWMEGLEETLEVLRERQGASTLQQLRRLCEELLGR